MSANTAVRVILGVTETLSNVFSRGPFVKPVASVCLMITVVRCSLIFEEPVNSVHLDNGQDRMTMKVPAIEKFHRTSIS